MKSRVFTFRKSSCVCSPFVSPLPQQLARAHRDLRLDGVVARIERILPGIEQHGHALHLVVGHGEGPHEGQDGEEDGPEDEQVPPLDARHHDHADPDGREDDARAQVGLDEDEQQHGRDDDERAAQRARGARVAALLREVARERQHDRDLGELRGLELDRPEGEPARRAELRLPQRDERQQQHDGGPVEPPGVVQEHVVIEPRDDGHGPHGGEGEERLPRHGVGEAGGGAVVGAQAAAVDERQPVGHERQRGEGQERVEARPRAQRPLPARDRHGATRSRARAMIPAATGAAFSPPTPRS